MVVSSIFAPRWRAIIFGVVGSAFVMPLLGVGQETVIITEQNRPSIGAYVPSYTDDTTYYWDTYTSKGDGGVGTTYETSHGDGGSHSSITITPRADGSLASYSFSGNDQSNTYTKRWSVGNKYPYYYQQCQSSTKYSPVLRKGGGQIIGVDQDVTEDSSCMGSPPSIPVSSHNGYRDSPASSRFAVASMMPIRCDKVTPYFASSTDPIEKTTVTTVQLYTTHREGVVVISVGGDPALDYYLEYDVAGADISDGIQNEKPLPARHVAGWVNGGNVYDVPPPSGSCVAYSPTNFKFDIKARKHK